MKKMEIISTEKMNIKATEEGKTLAEFTDIQSFGDWLVEKTIKECTKFNNRRIKRLSYVYVFSLLFVCLLQTILKHYGII